MEDLFIFMITFVIVFIVYLIIYFVKRKQGKLDKMKEFDILATKFNLKRKNINVNRLGLVFVLVNSLIISITGTVCTSIDLGVIWQLLIAFVLLMALIILCYGFIGKILQKRERKDKNEHKRNRK